MIKTILTATLLLFAHLTMYAQNDSTKIHTVTTSALIDYAPDSTVQQAAKVLKEFLLTKNAAVVQETPFISKGHIKDFFHLLFLDGKGFTSNIPIELFQFQIFDYKKEQNNFLFKTFVYFEFPEDKTSFTLVAIFKIWAVKTNKGYQLRLWADDYMKGFIRKETKWAVYYAQHAKYLEKQLLKKAEVYCDSLAKQFGISQQAPVSYIIIEPSPNAMQFFGLEYYWTDINFIDRKLGLIIDNKTASPFYKHELSHYVLRQFTDKTILMEGLATYTSGKANDVSTFANEVNLLKKEANYKDTTILKKILYGREMPWFRYPIGALLCKKAYETGGMELLKALQNTPEDQDILEIITQVFKLTKQTPEEFIIQLIEEYK